MSSNTEQAAPTGELTGDVVRPGDPRYEEARLGYNRLFDLSPAAIVFCTETQDAVNALSWARRHDVPVRVRSGRHCLEGWSSVDDGIVIDVSGLKSATIDEATGIATVGAGLNQGEAVSALGAVGLAAATGTEGTVGLVGATLGGGFGLLTRQLGMASDNLLAAEVVVATADGGAEAIVVDDEHHPDLMWALRGAGNGNFGIVTSLTYRVHPLPQAVYVTATWPGLQDLSAIFEAWQNSAFDIDDRLTTQLELTRDACVLVGVLARGTAQEARSLLAPILSVGAPEVVTQDAPWAEVYADFQIPPDEERANWKFFSQFAYEPFPTEAITLVASFLEQAPTPYCNYFTNAFGGAVRRSEPAGGSAFAHRNALFYAEPGAGWGERGGTPAASDPLTEPCLRWAADFADALAPYVGGAYVNVPNAGAPNWETDYWGPNVDRLHEVKQRYDPDHVFSYEHGVR